MALGIPRNWTIPFIILSILYWLWFGLVVGIDGATIGFYVLFLGLILISRTTRQLFLSFFPFFIYLICYSSLRILHDYNPFPIHNKALYDWEVKLFGVQLDGVKVSLCEFFNAHIHPFLDFWSGLFYITWAPFPILFGLYLFWLGKKKLVFDFWTCFLITNIFGFIIYIVLPAAPPWYFLEFGEQILLDAPNHPAGLGRFDQMVGIPVYEGMYSQGTNTYGALPSMHAAFPLVLSYYGQKHGNKWLTGLFLLSMLSIWFAAVYSNHHYLIDVLMGIGCGIIGIFLTEKLTTKQNLPNWYKSSLNFINYNPKEQAYA